MQDMEMQENRVYVGSSKFRVGTWAKCEQGGAGEVTRLQKEGASASPLTWAAEEVV